MENILQTKKIQDFENLINYHFNNKSLIKTAFTHPSFDNYDKSVKYQRLEFLGDSVLNFIVTNNLMISHPQMDEGRLTSKRADIINSKTLSKSAKELNLQKYILVGNSIKIITEKMLTDTYEAIIGAISLDSDIKNAGLFIKKTLLNDVKKFESKTNYKGKLIEFCTSKKISIPKYITNKKYNNFISEIVLEDEKDTVYGKGKTKKEAEHDVSRKILKKIKQTMH